MFDFAVNLSVLFCEWPLLDRFAAARDAGFTAVELQFPYEQSADRLARAARHAGVHIVLINGPPLTEGDPLGIACRPDRTDDFRAGLAKVGHYADAMGTRFVNVLAGRRPFGQHAMDCEDVLVDNLLLAHERLAPSSVLLEPLNPHDASGYFVSSLDAAHSILARCEGRIGLQFDVYHAAMMGLDPAREVERMATHVRHVQFADVPGRHEPGTGSLRFDEVLRTLAAIGYNGWVSAEYYPVGGTSTSLAWLSAWRTRGFGHSPASAGDGDLPRQ